MSDLTSSVQSSERADRSSAAEVAVSSTGQEPRMEPPSDRPDSASFGIWPTLLVMAGLVVLFIAERVIGEGNARNVLGGVASGAMILGTALRVQSALRATAEAKQAELHLGYAYAGIAAALVCYVLSTSWGLFQVLGLKPESAVAERAEVILMSLWPAIMTVSVFALLSMEYAYRGMPVAQAVELRRVRVAAHSGLSVGLALVFLFSVNYVAYKKDVRRDYSYFKTTRPSESTLKLVSKVEQPVHIYLFYPKANDVLHYIRPYFEQVAAASGKVKLEVVDAALKPKLAREQRVQGNGTILMVRTDSKGDVSASAPSQRFKVSAELDEARADLKKLDGTFHENLSKLMKPPRAMQLTVGHEERNASQQDALGPGEGVTEIKGLLQKINIRTSDLGIAQGLANKIAETSGAVAILGPKKPFMKEEVDAILAYVRNGGRLIVALDPDIDVGLAPLLEGLGVSMLQGVAASDTQHLSRARDDSDKTLVFANEYSSHPVVTTLSRHAREAATVFVNGGALSERQGAKPAPTVAFPLRSSSAFYRDLNANFKRDPNEPLESLNWVAVATFPPSGGQKEEGRAVIIADGDVFTDKIIRNPGNAFLFVDSLRWLIGEEDLAGEISSEEDKPIEHTRKEDKLWFYLTTFAVPVPILVVGLWVHRRRRKRAEKKS
jgi:hypothetical protein